MPYKHLVIIGNGFDLHCGLKTSYSAYWEYFTRNCESVMVNNGINSIDGSSPFHKTYGLTSTKKDYDFWSNYEESLAHPDFEALRSLPFEQQKQCLEDTIKLSDTIFRKWITETYNNRSKNCKQGKVNEDAFFINFNYTPTLQDLFSAHNEQVHYLHGNLKTAQRLIVGHNSGPNNRPKKTVYGNSEIGLRCFYEDTYMYDSDKKSNWIKLQMTSKNVGQLSVYRANVNKIKTSPRPFETHGVEQITILGHSINKIDMTYFIYIHNKTKMNKPKWVVSYYKDNDKYNAIRLMSTLRLPETRFEIAEFDKAANYVITYRNQL